MDARYVWMNRLYSGKPFAHLKQAAAANNLMVERRLDPCMSEVFGFDEIPAAHIKMRRNEHKRKYGCVGSISAHRIAHF